MHRTFSYFSLLFLVLPLGIYAQNTDYFGAGRVNGVQVSTSSNSQGNGLATINGAGMDQHLKDASRFLGQATLGYNYEDVEATAEQGIQSWLEAQYAMPMVSYKDTTEMIWEHFVDEYIEQWGEDQVIGNGTIFPLSIYFRMAWWNNTMKADDQLRQRVALALSEIFVVSEKSQLELNGIGLGDYYDVLYSNAFGNFRDLLGEVTLHPSMGFYLSHLNNERSNEDLNIRPDENYAREVMQLFTIGLYELNQDGSIIMENDEPIASYDNEDIQELAKVFTGLGPAQYWWMWEDFSWAPVAWGDPNNTVPTINLTLPMQMFEEWHEPGEKHLVNGYTIPAGQSGMEDINDALDHLFQHPNVGPFICKQLIQRLVKSNPTPDYIFRVASVFNDNGDGVRGDMKSVVEAILLDPEARDCEWLQDPTAGKMREPLIRYTQVMRAFDAFNESDKLWNVGASFEFACNQHVLGSPSVFNFFLPTHSPNGPIFDAGLVAPEFEILTSAAAINWVNIVYFWFLAEGYMDVSTQASGVNIGLPEVNPLLFDPDDKVLLDLSDELALSIDSEGLMSRMNILLAGGALSDETMETIADAVALLALFDGDAAVKSGIFLTLISPDYVIQK